MNSTVNKTTEQIYITCVWFTAYNQKHATFFFDDHHVLRNVIEKDQKKYLQDRS